MKNRIKREIKKVWDWKEEMELEHKEKIDDYHYNNSLSEFDTYRTYESDCGNYIICEDENYRYVESKNEDNSDYEREIMASFRNGTQDNYGY